ncbi:hypothetical protein SBF1_50089 [Candidatus Desulfosporosinus infrequens]|uniref:Uncharacterized protein n=1 Tax=Candidatus Desulfosporosinus infrequens TaxID=2043169 RepID=A0A2U3LGZ3_9FIRM|nr:hypothetical protein SBF1_50089 [Candidatus Desulfosporosinus infrequens]
MLRKTLEAKLGSMTNAEFREVMALTTNDIRANNVNLGKMTSMAYAVQVAEITLGLIRRYQVA